jgi:hypothetical protein
MITQPCDLKKVKGRPGVYLCARDGCKHPPLRMPIRVETGEPFRLGEFYPPDCTVPKELHLGDRVSIAIAKVFPGIKKCRSCTKREAILNRMDQWLRRRARRLLRREGPRLDQPSSKPFTGRSIR